VVEFIKSGHINEHNYSILKSSLGCCASQNTLKDKITYNKNSILLQSNLALDISKAEFNHVATIIIFTFFTGTIHAIPAAIT